MLNVFWTNVVTQCLLAEGVAHTEIKEVGVFDCLVGEAEHCLNDIQRDQFVDWFIGPAVSVVIEHVERIFIDLRKDVYVKVSRPVVI